MARHGAAAPAHPSSMWYMRHPATQNWRGDQSGHDTPDATLAPHPPTIAKRRLSEAQAPEPLRRANGELMTELIDWLNVSPKLCTGASSENPIPETARGDGRAGETTCATRLGWSRMG